MSRRLLGIFIALACVAYLVGCGKTESIPAATVIGSVQLSTATQTKWATEFHYQTQAQCFQAVNDAATKSEQVWIFDQACPADPTHLSAGAVIAKLRLYDKTKLNSLSATTYLMMGEGSDLTKLVPVGLLSEIGSKNPLVRNFLVSSICEEANPDINMSLTCKVQFTDGRVTRIEYDPMQTMSRIQLGVQKNHIEASELVTQHYHSLQEQLSELTGMIGALEGKISVAQAEAKNVRTGAREAELTIRSVRDQLDRLKQELAKMEGRMKLLSPERLVIDDPK